MENSQRYIFEENPDGTSATINVLEYEEIEGGAKVLYRIGKSELSIKTLEEIKELTTPPINQVVFKKKIDIQNQLKILEALVGNN